MVLQQQGARGVELTHGDKYTTINKRRGASILYERNIFFEISRMIWMGWHGSQFDAVSELLFSLLKSG